MPKPNLPPRPPRRPTPPPQRPRGADASLSNPSDAFARFLSIGSGGAGPDASETASDAQSETAAETRSSDADGNRTESLEPRTSQSQAEESARATTSNGTVVATEGTEPPPARDPRPTRPIYTLQEIHELTSIPYAKLSLFAAQHFDEIPWVGERYSPAYTRHGVEAFCRLYAAQNPGWQVPELGPERGWDDLGGLSARIHALASAQDAMADELDRAVESFLRPWSGEAQWEV